MSAIATLRRGPSRCSNSITRTFTVCNAQRTSQHVVWRARSYASKSFPSHNIVTMPALSPTMQSGNIGTWQKKVGDSIAPGDVLVEIETDKAQMDFEFQEEGVLAKILKDSGEKDVAVGNPIAVMIEEGGDVSAFDSFTMEDAGGEKSNSKPAEKEPKQEATDASEPPQRDSKTSPGKPKEEKDMSDKKPEESETSSIESESSGGRLQTALDREPAISPAARKLALEKSIAISQVKGTGPKGRITREDIEKAKTTVISAPPTNSGSTPAAYEDKPASSMRKTIAVRLTQSMNQNPHYFVQSTVSVTKLMKLRQALNASADGKYKLSVNDFLIKAVAIAARKVPAANSSWREDGANVYVRQHNYVDVSVAVATPVGLMTPIVKSAHVAGLESISTAMKDLGKRARDGKLKPEEYQGGTITISNMGMNAAVERFTAVINPPQACIVAVGAPKKVAVPVESEEDDNGIEWDEQIVLSGSFDHKVVDGAVGGEFMKELKAVIENPLAMLL